MAKTYVMTHQDLKTEALANKAPRQAELIPPPGRDLQFWDVHSWRPDPNVQGWVYVLWQHVQREPIASD